MFVPFDELPANSRVWIYPLNRPLPNTREKETEAALVEFIRQWQAHGQHLKASCCIALHRFIVLATDETFCAPSGCAIDRSVQAVNQIARNAGLEIMDRGHIFFVLNNTILPVPVQEIKKSLENGIWNAETPVFDTTVTTRQEFMNNPLPARNTWLNRYLKVSV
ncbi:MAG: hypothetical protein KatS3mg032_1432 [Cyclobacteriaceae bacterium]|nr:MAG: hypothetical protein KatS3mg032_1432 [Cyclobacteriaceae bacterium]